jgi:pyruvate/2-oxoglutarate dehydrogenase complex dihydrolipoamide acyltransferase (E2) component
MVAAIQPIESQDAFHRVTFPAERRLVLDSLRLGHHKPMMHALLEVDVTRPRGLLRMEKQSFTAFVAACVGRAVAAHPEVHALRDGFGRLVMFHDVDVSTIVEVDVGGRKFGLAYVLRAANRRTCLELGQELRVVKTAGLRTLRPALRLALRLFLLVPAFMRRMVYRAALCFPRFVKRHTGTVTLTAVGMFGGGIGWGVSAPAIHSLSVLVGGIGPRPPTQGASRDREVLCLTVSADHDIVDGAPLARFVRALRDLIENADGLAGPDTAP